uniref:Chromo domain-containing protein n=1 Tax=Peronospora matthiolae TaxID=2874970 RepID=A0AAV1U9B9_9STRA
MRTHPTYYVRSLRTYYQYEQFREAKSTSTIKGQDHLRVVPFQANLFDKAKRPTHAAERCPDELQSARHEGIKWNFCSQAAQAQTWHNRSNDRTLRICNCPLQCHEAHNGGPDHEPSLRVSDPSRGSIFGHRAYPTLEPDQVFLPPPHSLVDSGGGQRFLVKGILNHRDVKGVQTSYLVCWRGFPPAWGS